MKMIVMDMDGTLLNTQKIITHKTKEILIELQKQGVTLVLASGRPESGLIDYALELKMDKYNGYLISYNGAKLTQVNTKETLWEKVIYKQDGSQILKHLEKYDAIPMISDDIYMYVNDVYQTIKVDESVVNIIEYESRGGKYLLNEKENLASFLDFDLYKILIAANPQYLKKHHQKLSEPFEKEYQAMFTAPFYYEFTHKEADKGAALKTLCKITQIELEDVIGFGDDMNDLPFLEIVGEAVAMENANPKIKEYVHQICQSHEEDGIAHYLKEKMNG